MVVQVRCQEDLDALADLPRDRIAWVETSLEWAESPLLDGLALDVLLEHPPEQAPLLYRLAHRRQDSLPRVTIPAGPGLERAGRIAVALNLSVRILPGQPSGEVLQEMEQVLDRYLHDTRAHEPVEFFHGAMTRLLFGDTSTLWMILEEDPDLFQRQAPAEPGFVARHLERLVQDGAECATCPVATWCAGYFKQPDPAYDCGGVRELFDRIEQAAEQLRSDLSLAGRMTGPQEP